MSNKDRVDLQFNAPYGSFGIDIPKLRSRGGSSIKLPFRDYAKGAPLPYEKQVLTGVTKKEADDLMTCWPGVFTIKAPKKIKESEVS